MTKGLSAAGESSQKDLEVWAPKLPFPSFPRYGEEQTGKKQGWDVDTEWGAEKKALDEKVWCCPGSQPAAGAHPGTWRWIKQAEITPGG